MLGVIVNTVAILAGATVGLIFKKGIPERFSNTIIHGVALAVILIGLLGALEATNILLVIFSLVIGGIIGESIRIEKRLEDFGDLLQKRFSKNNSNIASGFVTTTLIYCVGPLAIIGALNSGLAGDHSVLFSKSLIDGVTAVVFAATLGVGALFSGVSVFIYEGIIVALSYSLKDILVGEVLANMSAIGGLLIVALGFKMISSIKIKVGNLLPAMFIPIIYYIILNLV